MRGDSTNSWLSPSSILSPLRLQPHVTGGVTNEERCEVFIVVERVSLVSVSSSELRAVRGRGDDDDPHSWGGREEGRKEEKKGDVRDPSMATVPGVGVGNSIRSHVSQCETVHG